jgi:hypothetical protein
VPHSSVAAANPVKGVTTAWSWTLPEIARVLAATCRARGDSPPAPAPWVARNPPTALHPAGHRPTISSPSGYLWQCPQAVIPVNPLGAVPLSYFASGRATQPSNSGQPGRPANAAISASPGR